MKISYDQIALEIDILVIKMAQTSSFQELNQLIEVFDAYLEATGWDKELFDKEYMKRIDEGWDNADRIYIQSN